MRGDTEHMIQALGGMMEWPFVDVVDHSAAVVEEDNSRLRRSVDVSAPGIHNEVHIATCLCRITTAS